MHFTTKKKTMKRNQHPAFNLKASVQRLTQIHKVHNKLPIARDEAAHAIGLSGGTGSANQWLATLTRYGLLQKAGSKQVAVTDLAERILLALSSEDRLLALEDALKHPPVFGELHAGFPEPFSATRSAVSIKLQSIRSGEYNLKQADFVANLFVESAEFIQHERVSAAVGAADQDERTEVPSTGTEDRSDQLPQPELDVRDHASREILEGFKELCGTQLNRAGSEVKVLYTGSPNDLGPHEFNVIHDLVKTAELAMVRDNNSETST